MRDKINVLYYPDMVADQTTLKKAILFFDEIHFMDRPSFTFDGGMGTIGMKSPLREFEQLFRRDNVPIHIHEPLNGRLNGDLLEKISADINDLRFLSIFQEGLRTSETYSQVTMLTWIHRRSAQRSKLLIYCCLLIFPLSLIRMEMP